MKKNYLIVILLFVIASCSEHPITDNMNENDDQMSQAFEDIKMTDAGYLSFKTKEVFDNYINSLKEEYVSSQTRAAIAHYNIPEFMSINALKESIQNQSTRSAEDSEDIEEGSEDEFRISIAEELIKDDVLYNVLDTTLRISIEDMFYKVTELGTFYCSNEHADNMDEIISGFDQSSVLFIADDIYKINDSFYFCDSYGLISGDETIMDIELVEDEEETAQTRSVEFGTIPQNSSYYGLGTYTWKNKTVVGQFTSWLLGKDVSRELNFDSKHRVKCELYQVNYGFYASTGFKVNMQKRKKFLFVKYWVNTSASDIVIGIERLSGKMKFNYYPGTIASYGTFTSTWQGVVNNMVYGGLSKPTFIEDFVNEHIATVFPGITKFEVLKWTIDPWSWTDNLTKDAIYEGLNSLTGKVANAAGKKLTKQDPRIALVMSKRGELETHITGIRSFGSGSSKTIRFSQSGGFTYKVGGVITGYIPDKFAIQGASIFGAVKYNGKWKGIRFEHK
jgi:hypothetical protein